MPRSSQGYSKSQEETAERIAVRYTVSGNIKQAVMVYNTATCPDAAILAKRTAARLRKEGRKGVEVIRWTPKF